MRLPVYLDAPSTTPVDPRVREAMLPFFTERFGHPSSRQHLFGADAEGAVAIARGQVADLIGAEADEIVFTSGGTESDNLAVRGTMQARRAEGDHVVTCATEHRAVLESCRRLVNEGFHVSFVAVDAEGRVDPAEVARAITDRTVLVSVMVANHETGTLQPAAEIGAVSRARSVPFHANAVQAVPWVKVDVDAIGADLLTLSAHKIYGPKGIGALFVRRRGRRARLSPLMEGGSHERGLRPGTVPVPLAVGFGVAAELCRTERDADSARTGPLRDRLRDLLRARIPDAVENGDPAHRLPGICNMSFPYVESESLLLALRQQVAASSGSGCTSDSPEPSYILEAMGVGPVRASSSIRFGLSRFTTAEEVDFAAEAVAAAVSALRTRTAGLDATRPRG